MEVGLSPLCSSILTNYERADEVRRDAGCCPFQRVREAGVPVIIPERHKVETAAYYCYKLGGERPGHDQADWLQGEQLVFLADNYDVLANYALRADRKLVIGPEENRRCRYCGAAGPFEMVANAVPELIGNRAIISNDECDGCNTLFAKGLEDHLGKMLNGLLNLTRVTGKKGVPTLTTRDRHSRVEVRGDDMSITAVQTDPLVTWDPATRTVTVTTHTQPHVPLAVFKTLVKMALAIMPATELQLFHHAVAWIREPDHAEDSADFAQAARCYLTFLPGPMQPEVGWVRLLRRRSPDAELPYMLLVTQFRNAALQIMVPCCPLDNHWVGKLVQLPSYPVFYGYGYHWGEPTREVRDLSSPVRQSIPFRGQLTTDSDPASR